MSPARSWLRNAGAAARLVAGRPDLWLAGAVGSIAYLGWLPLVLTVTSLPKASDLAFIGAGLYSSGLYPWNVVLLAGAAGIVALLACALAALSAAALRRGLAPASARSLAGDTEAAFSIILVAALPAAAALAAFATGVAAVAPAEYGAPDIGTPLALRIVLRLAPLGAAVVVLWLAGQAVGAAALARGVGRSAQPAGEALRGGLRDLLRHAPRRATTAVTCLVVDLAALAAAVALLGLAWAPVRVEAAAGQLGSPRALVGLVGFVAVWIALLGGYGALHALTAAWWAAEQSDAGEAARLHPQEVQS